MFDIIRSRPKTKDLITLFLLYNNNILHNMYIIFTRNLISI